MQASAEIQDKKTPDTDYEIHHLIAKRWSPRMFSDQDVDKEDLKTIFEAARWAASSSNEQPWRFIYSFRGSKEYDKIFNCLSDFNRKWVRNAPVLMLTAYKEKFDSGKENFHALHDLGLAVGNMSLQAASMDIGLHQMAGVDWEKAQEVFDVPKGYHVATAIAVGYFGGDPSEMPGDLEKQENKERKRNPQEEFVSEGKWGF